MKLLQGRSAKADWHYRDKYNKFVYSSHYPMNIVQKDDICPWDNTLVLRDRRTRKSAGRGELEQGQALQSGIETAYTITFGGVKANIRSTILADGEFELRVHRLIASLEPDSAVEIVEGSSALGLDSAGDVDHASAERFSVVRNKKTGLLIASWPGPGWTGVGAAWDFGSDDSAASNVIYPRMEVNTLWAPVRQGVQVLYSVHYASPKPLANPALHSTAARLLARGRALAGGAHA